MTVSAEGRVENQKLNQTAALLSFGLVLGFQLDLPEKNLITLTRVTFTGNDLMQGVSLNNSNDKFRFSVICYLWDTSVAMFLLFIS